MSPELAAEFPTIKTYRGQGIDQPAATIRLDYTEHGFHAQVLSPDGQYYVDPYFHLQTDFYMSYFKQDAIRNEGNTPNYEALYNDEGELIYVANNISQSGTQNVPLPSERTPHIPTAIDVGEHDHDDHDHDEHDHDHDEHDHDPETPLSFAPDFWYPTSHL